MTDPSMLAGYKLPDPNAPSPRSPVWLWIVTLLLLGVVVVNQQLRQEPPPTRQERLDAAAGLSVEPPRTSTLILFGKLAIFVHERAPGQAGQFMDLLKQQAGLDRPTPLLPPKPTPPPTPASPPSDGSAPDDALGEDQNPPAAPSPAPPPAPPDAAGETPANSPIPPPAENRFRVAIIEGEVIGPEAAIERLNDLIPDLAPESPLHDDIDAALTVYRSGPDALDPTAAADLEARHAWFGRLLLSYGKPNTDPFRSRMLASALTGFAVLGGLMLAVVFFVLAGLVLLIIGAVMAANGRMRPAMASTRPGGRLWLETFAVFIAGFLVLQVATIVAQSQAPRGATWPIWLNLGGQWSLVLLVFWPLLRGMSFERFRGEVGWHRGHGFFREAGVGLLTYIAALPVYFGLAVLLLLVMQLLGGDEPPPTPDDRVSQLLDKGGPGVAVLLASLVVLWAPLVEETIFRGALFRAVRSRSGALGAALITAVIFAVMHAYAPIQLILVGSLGLVFALMREWRGSLIPSMAAHCLHNTFVLTVMIVVLRLASG